MGQAVRASASDTSDARATTFGVTLIGGMQRNACMALVGVVYEPRVHIEERQRGRERGRERKERGE